MDRADTTLVQDGGPPDRSHPSGPPDRPVPERPPGGPGLRPAMVVLGVAAVILLVFAISAAVTNGGNAARLPPRSTAPVKVHGTSLLAIPGAHALRGIEQGGLPPANIVRAVSIPASSVVVATQNNSAGTGQYDQQVVLSVHASQLAVFNFFTAELPAWKWQVFSTGPASHQPGTIEVLGKLAGDDGWYWEMGALVAPTTFGATGLGSTPVANAPVANAPVANAPVGGAGAGTNTTRFTIRLFQVSDEQ